MTHALRTASRTGHRGGRLLGGSALLIALLSVLGGCSSLNNPIDFDRPRTAAEVPGTIELARAHVAEGRTGRALQLLGWAREVRGLGTRLRDEVETLLDSLAERRIEELSGQPEGARELSRMVDMGLPNQLAVAAGLRSARLYLDQGRRYKAYRLLRRLEDKYPRHHGKVEAGAILAEAGLSAIQEDSSFLGMFTARDEGIEMLEYLVLTYPADRRCAEAYDALARAYEEDRRWTLARERHEDLRLWHADSPLAVNSEAMIPKLRLRALGSPEYERRELLKARYELETWLANHAGHELEDDVRADLADCMARLVENDLSVARFYVRVDQYAGARLHASRALADASEAGLTKLEAKARRLVQGLPDDSRSKTPDAAAFSADDSLIRTTIEERERAEAGLPLERSEEPAP